MAILILLDFNIFQSMFSAVFSPHNQQFKKTFGWIEKNIPRVENFNLLYYTIILRCFHHENSFYAIKFHKYDSE